MDKMKKLDLVKLKNDRPYKSHNLNKDMHGIVVDVNFDDADVLFFNPHNVGDYAMKNFHQSLKKNYYLN